MEPTRPAALVNAALVAAALGWLLISQFYYDLQLTLLMKSIILMASGALFLAAWYIIRKTLQRDEAV